MIQEIKLENVGPIKHLSFPVPENGGLVVLRARNGRGKTRGLEAIDSAITGRGKIDVRDGALSGSVEAFGARIAIGRKTTRTGELECSILDGKFNVADLVDPGLKAADAADARRIKALVQLANVLPSADLFYELVGGRESFERHIGTNALAADDLVVMADRIKRDLEAAARKEESQAEHAEGRARGCREAAEGVDVAGECDPTKLDATWQAAVRHESKLSAEADAAKQATNTAREARYSLEDAEEKYDGPSLAKCLDAEQSAESAVVRRETAVRELEKQLTTAKSDFESARVEYSHAIRARKTAEEHEAMIAEWRKQIAASIPTAPPAEAITKASEAVQAARQAVEQGGVVRRAKEQVAAAEKHTDEAQGHRQAADKLRNAARGTDEVLSQVVAKSGTALRVEAGRLVLETSRGTTYFADLSHGERWKIALDIAIDAVGERGVFTIPQEAFESLDSQNRNMIAEHLAGSKVVVVTAEASDDEEIQAEVYAVN